MLCLTSVFRLAAIVTLTSAAAAPISAPVSTANAATKPILSGPFVVASPDGRIEFEIATQPLRYAVRVDGTSIIENARLGLETSAGELGHAAAVGLERRDVDRIVRPVRPLWRAEAPDRFHEMRVELASGLAARVRAADDGVALRFEIPGRELEVKRETFEIAPSAPARIAAPKVDCLEPGDLDCFHDAYEHTYVERALAEMPPGELTQMPALLRVGDVWLALGEAEVFDYPGSWLKRLPQERLAFEAPREPLHVGQVSFIDWSFEAVFKREDRLVRYERKTAQAAARELPWRALQIGRAIGDLYGREFLTRLSDESRRLAESRDWSWAQPGLGTDEWIIDAAIGLDPAQVGFVPGRNDATYKYYVDFAARLGMRYVIIDDGWTDANAWLRFNPEVNVPEIARYARAKGIGIILWFQSYTVRNHLQATLDFARDSGAAGVEVDFFQRDDVAITRFQERLAEETARRKLVLSLHGTNKPMGLEIRYPHVLTVEAGLGHEFNRGTTEVSPRHRLDLALIRALAGPFDYEGTSMLNRQPESFVPDVPRVASQGTRASELALSLLYPSALQIVAGDPVAIEADPATVDWLSALPTTWDETRVLEATFGRFFALAKRKGETWYVAAISAVDERTLVQVDLSFLGPGDWQMRGVQDAPESDVDASAYAAVDRTLGAGARRLAMRLARNGGFVARLTKKTTTAP